LVDKTGIWIFIIGYMIISVVYALIDYKEVAIAYLTAYLVLLAIQGSFESKK
jgi:hypothetical protein